MAIGIAGTMDYQKAQFKQNWLAMVEEGLTLETAGKQALLEFF